MTPGTDFTALFAGWSILGLLLILLLLVLTLALRGLYGHWQETRERQARLALRVPAGHPERVAGSDRAAKRRYFRRLAREVGFSAADIIEEEQRGL